MSARGDSLDEALRRELAGRSPTPSRWSIDPADAERSIAGLVLTLVDFLRQLLERRAICRMEAGRLSPGQIEHLGLALMRLEEAVRELAARFGLDPDDLNLDLGPLGRLR